MNPSREIVRIAPLKSSFDRRFSFSTRAFRIIGHLRFGGAYAARMLNAGQTPKLCDMCGRPLWRKKNFLDWCSARSGADMCAAFDAAHTPQARMGVRGSGPNQSHALEAPVAKLVFLIPSQ